MHLLVYNNILIHTHVSSLNNTKANAGNTYKEYIQHQINDMKNIALITIACITLLSCSRRIHTGVVTDKRNDWYMQSIGGTMMPIDDYRITITATIHDTVFNETFTVSRSKYNASRVGDTVTID